MGKNVESSTTNGVVIAQERSTLTFWQCRLVRPEAAPRKRWVHRLAVVYSPDFQQELEQSCPDGSDEVILCSASRAPRLVRVEDKFTPSS